MTTPTTSDSGPVSPARDPQSTGSCATSGTVSDESVQQALDQGDKEKIDQTLDELGVSTTESGKDQSHKPDTEGSNSSSKNLDEQND